MLVFGQPVVDEAAIDAVAAVLRSGWLGRGPQVQAFEQMFAQYVGSRHACALNSCSAGLFLSLHLLGIGRGDEVITTPMTFPATLNAIVNIGAMPVLVDVNRNDQNLDPEAIPQAITKRTRAIMPVHMTGRPCDMAAIRAVADEHGLPVIEDAAHALGACYRGHRIGSLSEFTAFSFQASKNLTTGDGGMLTTDNDEWAARARMLSVHGMSRDAWVQLESGAEAAPMSAAAGFKFTMTDIHAAMGLQQLPHFDEWQELRTRIWRRYDEALADLALEIPERPPPEMLHARHLYTVMLDIETLGRPRDELRAALRAEGIGTGVHYVPAHLHPYYAQRLGHERGSFPNAEWIGERTLSLPLSRALREDDQSDVIRAMQRVLT